MVEMSKRNYIAVVAIDFGTSFSGFAFAFNHHRGETGIHMNKAWGYDVGFPSYKTPTCLLLKPDLTFDRFGFEAQEKYAHLEDADEQKSFYYFERFKMVLHRNKTLNRKTKLKAKNGESVPATEVFAISISYLKDKALETLKERTSTEYTANDIKWVITVPAIWKPPAKQFMREAARNARIFAEESPGQVIIALEPEAAGLFCRQLKMSDFISERGDKFVKDTVAGRRTQYLVCDIGGGTLDMTAHEIIDNNDIREIHHATGGDFGGIKVDAEFEKLMEAFFGENLMNELRHKYPSDFLEIMTDWEMKKRSKRAVEGEVTRVKLSYNFMHLYTDQKPAKSLMHKFSSLFSERPPYDLNEVSVSKGHLCLKPGVMNALFHGAISSIIREIRKVLKKSNLANTISCIFLVGGFSDCQLLQTAVRKEFELKYRVLVPEEASLAVAKGAVVFGQSPDIITERVLAETYGTQVCHLFEECDPESKLILVEGERQCRDRFCTLVTAGEVVKTGECRTKGKFSPLRRDQTVVLFDFYSTERVDIPRYVDEDGVKKLEGHVTVECPVEQDEDRQLELKMFFGGTEIKVVGTDLNSGKNATAFIDFLAE